MDYRIKVQMSQSGRSSRDQHSLVFRGAPTGAYDHEVAAALAVDLANALASYTFDTTNFLRVTFTELTANGQSVLYSSDSIPLSIAGFVIHQVGDGVANEDVCLAIEKAARPGKSGVSLFRHCISANELAAYENAATVPARFGSAPAGSEAEGLPIGNALLNAFTANNWEMKLPPKTINGFLTERVVSVIAAQDFRHINATKRKTDPVKEIARNAQRLLDQYARQAQHLLDRFSGGTLPPDAIATILEIIELATNIYQGLTLAERVLVKLPRFPVLP